MPPRPGIDGLTSMLDGTDLATVRLVIAALDPDLHMRTRETPEVTRG